MSIGSSGDLAVSAHYCIKNGDAHARQSVTGALAAIVVQVLPVTLTSEV
jgi:hypothetical protein